MKTLICPNCGAPATNYQNCEWCGSLLVRFKNLNIQIDSSKYGKDAITFAGLKDALKNNLEEQNRTDGKNHIHTWIKNPSLGVDFEVINPRAAKDSIIYTVSFDSGEYDYHIMPNNDCVENQQSLVLCFRFLELGKSATMFDSGAAALHNADQEQLKKFSTMPEFQLFKHVKEDLLTMAGIRQGVLNSYYIDLGQDYEGAAEIITQYLKHMYGIIPENVQLSYELTSETDEEYKENVKNIQSKSEVWFWVGMLFFGVGGPVGVIFGALDGDLLMILSGIISIVFVIWAIIRRKKR